MRFFIFLPGSFFVLLIVFLIGVTRQPLSPEELYPAPKNVKELLRRGDLYKERGEYEKALLDYTQAVKLEPDSSDAYQGQAFALSALDRSTEAIEKYKIVRQIEKQNGKDYKFTEYFIRQEEQKLRRLHQQAKP